MDGRNGSQYYAQNLLSDVLGNGESSRLYPVAENGAAAVHGYHAYVSGSMDTGMFGR